MGEDLLKQFRFSLMLPSDFSNVVMPTEILFLTEVIDVFKQFTSVSIPGGFKFLLSPRKTVAEPLSSFNTGEVQVPDQEASGATSDVSDKTGLFTFAVKKDISLRGVVIVTDKDHESCQVSLSITEKGKKVKQIKSKTFMRKETIDSDSHGEVNVFFNRPLNLKKNTCYSIETETDTTNNRNCGVVRPRNKPINSAKATGSMFGSNTASCIVGGLKVPTQSPFQTACSPFTPMYQSSSTNLFAGYGSTQGSTGYGSTLSSTGVPTSGAKAINSSSSEKIDKVNEVSCCSFGKCHLKCPDHSEYSGEIIQLLFEG